jgi:hypothetical protein
MNATIIRAGVFLALVGTVAATEPQVRVAASRELRLAVIDSNKSTEARDAMHQAFATSLGASLTQQCGGSVGVRMRRVGVDHAAFNLGSGVYDAVLVVGREVPTGLRRTRAIMLSAAPEGSANHERSLYLLIAEGDASLQGLLATAFTRTVNDESFLQRLAVAEGRIVASAGEKIASAQ